MYKKHNLRVITLGLAIMGSLCAQGPVGNTVYITLDQNALVGSNRLTPGDYTIRQVTSASNPRVLEFTTNKGTKLAATVTAIPFLQNTPPSSTKVIFDNERGERRISRILVQGKDYGYEFPKELTASRSPIAATAVLRYNNPNSTVADTSSTRTTTAQDSTIAQSQPAPVNQPAAPPREESTGQTNQRAEPTIIAQNTPQQNQTQQSQTQPAAQPQRNEAQQPTPPQQSAAPAQQSTAAQESTAAQQSTQTQRSQTTSSDRAPSIPATALGWADLLAVGFTCVAVGVLMLRRAAQV